MAGVQARDFASPDETRTPDKTQMAVVRMGGATAARLTFEPGWRWSECLKPVVHTESCQNSHVCYAVSGRMTVAAKDGTKKVISAGESYTIPPGHDAWVDGSEPFVCIEVLSAEQFGKPHSH